MNTLYTKIYESIDTGLQKVLVFDDNDSSVNYRKSTLSTDIDPYEYRFVDMGDGILWAEYNIGAFPGDKPEDWYGYYYAWGEIEQKHYYGLDGYRFYDNVSRKMTKYSTELSGDDHKTTLEPGDDIVSLTLGNQYRMPTNDDFDKLANHAIHRCVKNYNGINGLDGMLFIADNKNTLFFPETDIIHYYRKQMNVNNKIKSTGIWSSSLDTTYSNNAYFLWFSNDKLDMTSGRRTAGMPIRAVCDKK